MQQIRRQTGRRHSLSLHFLSTKAGGLSRAPDTLGQRYDACTNIVS